MNMKKLCPTVLGAVAVLSCAVVARAQDQADQEKIFLARASEGNLAEIKQSQLALDKSTNPEVKAFAQTMITDHTELGQKMKPFAEKYGAPPETTVNPDHQAEIDKLNTLSGPAFDKEYIKSMDKDHHATQDLFAEEIGTTKDNDLKATVTSGAQVVDAHTKMADKLATKMNIHNPNDGSNQ